MKIVKWGKVRESKGKDDVLIYADYEGFGLVDSQVFLVYGGISGRVCYEIFPPTNTDALECFNRGLTTEEALLKGTLVQDLETVSDFDDKKAESLVVVYEKKDIEVWINKLQDILTEDRLFTL